MLKRVWALVASALIAGAALSPAFAQSSGDVSINATIDKVDVGTSTEDFPIILDPLEAPVLSVEVRNDTAATIHIKTVRLYGQVMGLTFYSYDTSVGMTIDAGERESRTFELDLFGLDGQAVGLIPSTVGVLNEDRETLAEETLMVDVRGSLTSVYGTFGLSIALVTVIALITGLVKLAKQTLPPNRWRRAMRFGTPGFGLGLVTVFTVSALSIFAPTADKWIPLVAGSFAVFFLLGYVTPSPAQDDEEEGELDEFEELMVSRSSLRTTAPTQPTAPPTEPVRPSAQPGEPAVPPPTEVAEPPGEARATEVAEPPGEARATEVAEPPDPDED